MSEKDILNFTREDLATKNDFQYITAENILLKSIKRANLNTTYDSNKANLNYALR